MSAAQGLYQAGHITYHRTDSISLSTQAISSIGRYIQQAIGAKYHQTRNFKTKKASAQEAHEAIRPAGTTFRTPAELKGELSGDQWRLYELIFKRTLASQMTDAKGFTATVKVGAKVDSSGGQLSGKEAVFSASGTVITTRGFLAVYEEGRDSDDSGKSGDREVRLPALKVGQAVAASELAPEGHSTNPPARFTEASLVKALEELGIGRPSTYAATISTIQDRGYVQTSGQALVPTWLSFAVTNLLELHFDWLVDYEFTAKMEADLDEIAVGNRDRRKWLEVFYFGDGTGREDRRGINDRVEHLPDIDAVAINSVPIADGLRLRVGRFGPYIEDLAAPVKEGENPPRVSVPDGLAPDELTATRARELFASGADEDRMLGVEPDSGHQVVVKNGRYGPYVTELIPEPELDPNLTAAAKKKALAALPKPRSASLFKDMTPESVTMEQALQLLSLPRVVGTDPDSGLEITAQNGRFGPYLKKGTDSRTIASEALLFTMTLPEALAIYSEPKTRGGRTVAAPLKELGLDPESQKPIVIKDGRFGPYITDGVTNRTVPRDLSVESITAEQAIALLAEKRAAGPSTRRKPAAKKPAARKPAAKKPAVKK
jgi:DNA topoisomerase-1